MAAAVYAAGLFQPRSGKHPGLFYDHLGVNIVTAGQCERLLGAKYRLDPRSLLRAVKTSLGSGVFEAARAEERAMPIGHAIALARQQAFLLRSLEFYTGQRSLDLRRAAHRSRRSRVSKVTRISPATEFLPNVHPHVNRRCRLEAPGAECP